jgi:hypothetical protein
MSVKVFFISFLVLFYADRGHSSFTFAGKKHLVNGCKIFSLSGTQIKRTPGEFCQFFDNGDFLSMSSKTLKYITSKGEVKWSVENQLFHHQMNLSPDLKRVLTLGSVEKEIQGRLYRVDQFLVLDVSDGKILHKVDADVLMAKSDVNPTTLGPGFPKNFFKATEEYSHFNSFYEIPKFNFTKKIHPALEPGNFIVNSIGLGFLVIDHKFEKILLKHKLDQSFLHHIHDVQLTERGTLIAFNNLNATKDLLVYSTVIEFDSLSFKTIREFKADPASMFYSHHCGGVQDLGRGLVLFSHNYAGVFIYNFLKKKMVYSNLKVFLDGDRILPTQQIKIENLDSFLKNNTSSVF